MLKGDNIMIDPLTGYILLKDILRECEGGGLIGSGYTGIGDDNAPDYIAQCKTLKDSMRQISCLQSLKLIIGQNPDYLRPIDREINNITGNYEGSGEAPMQEFVGAETIAIIAVGTLIAATVNVMRHFVKRELRKCMKTKGLERKRCILFVRIEGLKKQIGALNKAAAKCAKTKNPQECKQKIMLKIKSLNEQIKTNTAQLQQLKGH